MTPKHQVTGLQKNQLTLICRSENFQQYYFGNNEVDFHYIF